MSQYERMMPVGEEFEASVQPEVVVQKKPGSDQPPVIQLRVVQDHPLNAEQIMRIQALATNSLLADAKRRALVEESDRRSWEHQMRRARQAFGWGVGVGFLILIAIETALLQLARH